MSSLIVTGLHMESTAGTHDKFYRAVAVGNTHVATAYGPRGRVPGTVAINTVEWATSEVESIHISKRRRGYSAIRNLRYATSLPSTVARTDPAALMAEFDTVWAARTAPDTAALAAAAAQTGTGLHVAILPKFLPPRGNTGGLRDARPWGPPLAAALQHIRTPTGSRDTYAIVTAPVAAWIRDQVDRATTAALPTGTDPARILDAVVDLTTLTGTRTLPETVELAAAVLA